MNLGYSFLLLTGLGQKLSYDGLRYQFSKFYKKSYFPNLLEEEAVPELDKSLIRFMLTKPWAIYVFRHSSLTEKSRILKESVLSTRRLDYVQ